jgi:hypothetical protein
MLAVVVVVIACGASSCKDRRFNRLTRILYLSLFDLLTRAHTNSWKMTNFSVNYCYQFMMMLQGRIPVRVRLFLIVNRTFTLSRVEGKLTC